jgi:hypothetical protein
LFALCPLAFLSSSSSADFEESTGSKIRKQQISREIIIRFVRWIWTAWLIQRNGIVEFFGFRLSEIAENISNNIVRGSWKIAVLCARNLWNGLAMALVVTVTYASSA